MEPWGLGCTRRWHLEENSSVCGRLTPSVLEVPVALRECLVYSENQGIRKGPECTVSFSF